MIEIAVGLGIVLSLILSETVGVTAGGLIVPGYIAFNLHDPLRVVGTMGVSLLVFLIVKGLSIKILIYGKRRLAFCLLLGFLLGYLSIIANWMERQGVLRTISVVIITASIIQLLMMLLGLEIPHV